MTVKPKTCSLELEITQDACDELEDMAWAEGFDKIEDLVRCVINRYLRSNPNFDLKEDEPDPDMIQLDCILYYTRLLKLISAACDSVESQFRRLFWMLDKIYAQMVIEKYCSNGLTLGQLLRDIKSNFSGQATNYQLYLIYKWLENKYPEHEEVLNREVSNMVRRYPFLLSE